MFTLRFYTHGMKRDDGERDRLHALVEGTVLDPAADTLAPHGDDRGDRAGMDEDAR